MRESLWLPKFESGAILYHAEIEWTLIREPLLGLKFRSGAILYHLAASIPAMS